MFAHPEGAEVLSTLRQLDLSDAEFERDAALVEADLRRLKDLLKSCGRLTVGLAGPRRLCPRAAGGWI